MIRLPPYKPSIVKPVWDLTFPIGEVELRYKIVWRPRRDAWYIDLWADDTKLFSGLRCSEDLALVWRYRRVPPLPLGRLWLYDITGAHSAPTQESLGWQHVFYWVEPSDQAQPDPVLVTVT